MGRLRVVWLLSLPLAACGWLAAHTLAFALVEPGSGDHAREISDAGHHYLGAAPVFLAFAITVLLAGVVLAIDDGARRAPAAHVPVWPVALMSPVGFAVQEHLECLVGLHRFPIGAALDPTFLFGMALQVPFAVAAVMLARSLLAFGRGLGQRLVVGCAPRPLACIAPPFVATWLEPELARPSILATGHGERAPPGLALI